MALHRGDFFTNEKTIKVKRKQINKRNCILHAISQKCLYWTQKWKLTVYLASSQKVPIAIMDNIILYDIGFQCPVQWYVSQQDDGNM